VTHRGFGWGPALLAAALLLGALSGCRTQSSRAEPPPVRFTIADLDVKGPNGPRCNHPLDLIEGPVPVGAVVVFVVVVEASRATRLKDLEAVAANEGRRRCVDGVSVLSAEAADGATGYLSLRAKGWWRPDEADSPGLAPAPAQVGDAPPPPAPLGTSLGATEPANQP
jgi:hypothetical protein